MLVGKIGYVQTRAGSHRSRDWISRGRLGFQLLPALRKSPHQVSNQRLGLRLAVTMTNNIIGVPFKWPVAMLTLHTLVKDVVWIDGLGTFISCVLCELSGEEDVMMARTITI